jgi:SAM-dependent methyltransferase
MANLRRLLSAYRCGDTLLARRELRLWYRTVLGRELLAMEQGKLNGVLTELFGYHLVQIGSPAGGDLLGQSRIKHRVILDGDGTASDFLPIEGTIQCIAQSQYLPFENDAIDVMVLPHSLEFEENPHQILREVERTLIPEGHIIIVGFNPYSLWGLTRLVIGWRRRPPWCGHFYSTLRIRDWLALLGFDIVLVRGCFFRPPLQHEGSLEKLNFMERFGARWWPLLGGCYILVAKKRLTTLTPIKPRWKSGNRFLGGRLVEPSANRNQQ